MEKLKELEAALSGNNLEAIWLASAAWAAQREGTASTSSHEGTLTLKSLDRLLSLAVGCCKDIDPKNCYIMSLAVMHMAPLAAQKSNKEELKLVKQGLRGCLRFLLENFLLKEAKLAPGDEIQLCISLQNFCVGFEKVVEICHCSDAATVADCLFPSGDGLAVCEAIHRAVLQPLPQREAVEDADQKKLQDLCHFCRWKVSRAVTQLLCHALNAASKLGWQGGTARLCKEETCKALWHEARCGSDAARQQLCLELLWQITRRTKNCKAGETIQRPQFLVKFLEEVTCGKMIQNTAPKDFPARKAKMLNEVSECGGGILQGTCALRWGHLNQEKVKVMLTKHSFSLEFPGVAQVMEVPWACLLLPEILMHKDRPSSAQWPLQVGIDPYAAMVLRAIPPEIAKSIDQQQVMTLEVDEDAMSFIGKLHDLLHGNDVHQNALTAPGKTSSSSKADVKKTAAKAQPKVPPTRRVTRSMTRSQSLAAPLTSAPAPPVRSASEPIHRPEGPPKKVQEFPSSTVAPQAVAPPDGNKKKGLWEKASDIARSAKAMLGATVATPARAVSSAAVPTPTLKRCRSASPGRRSSTDPNSLSSEACPSGLNSAPPAGPFATRRARSADPTPTTRAVPAVKRSRSEGRHVKKTSTDATTTSSTTQLHVKNPLTPAAAPPTPSANQPPVKNPLTPAAAPTESANQPLVKNPLTPAAAPTPSANQPLAKNPLTPAAAPPTPSANHPPAKNPLTPAAAPPTPSANHPPVKNPLTPAVAPPTPFAIIPSAPRRRSRSRQPQDCTPTSLPATPSTANPRARSRSRQPGQESTPTSLPATPGMAQSNPRARSRSRQTGRDTPFTPPTAPPPSPPMAPMPHPMPPRTRSRSEPPREAEVPSPGGVSLASRTSRVSLGEAAGLANEAANLGIMGPDRLRQMCSDQGLPREGLRTELISRLLIHRLTSAPRTVNEFSPLSPSFAPFSGPNQSELRAACVQRGLSDIGSSYDLLQRLQVSRNSQGADSTAALKARSGLAAARKVALEGTGAAQSTETPRKRLRCKSPASALYGRPQEPAVTPPKRLRCKSPASARPDLKEGLSAVCGAAVQSLLTLRPEQLEAECQRQGLSPRRSPHAMAYRLATARLQNLGSPSSADSAARTEIVSPGSILKRGKFGKSPPARTRSASKPPTPTSARGASQRRSATPNPRQSPRSTPNPRGAGRSQSRTVKSPGSGKRATSEPKTPPRTRSASKLRTPTSARGASQRRSATPNPRQTPRSRTPNTRGKSPAASLLCGAPGVAASPEKTLPSTPQRRSQPRSNVPTGDKVRRQSKPSGKVAHEKPRTPTPRRSPKSPTMTRRELCHATKRGGLPCNFPGSKRPTGALFFYCGYHAEKWRAHERR